MGMAAQTRFSLGAVGKIHEKPALISPRLKKTVFR